MRKTSVIFDDVQYLFLKNTMILDIGAGTATRGKKSEITFNQRTRFRLVDITSDRVLIDQTDHDMASKSVYYDRVLSTRRIP